MDSLLFIMLSSAQISAGILAMLAEFFMAFLGLFRQMLGQHLKLGHGCLLSNPF
jgi:hypothetical protein